MKRERNYVQRHVRSPSTDCTCRITVYIISSRNVTNLLISSTRTRITNTYRQTSQARGNIMCYLVCFYLISIMHALCIRSVLRFHRVQPWSRCSARPLTKTAHPTLVNGASGKRGTVGCWCYGVTDVQAGSEGCPCDTHSLKNKHSIAFIILINNGEYTIHQL